MAGRPAGGRPAPVLQSQPLAVGLGIACLIGAAWAFNQAWEARGQQRPAVARWLAV
ncbi:MAG: hypothetical protein JWM85_387 [Acidimicrobiaceae bacterium]|nr:hypothetical protein [Acidimicrobiaceae bacterium]